MIVKLLTEHHLEFLSLKGGCRGSSKSTLVKSQIVGNLMPRLVSFNLLVSGVWTNAWLRCSVDINLDWFCHISVLLTFCRTKEDSKFKIWRKHQCKVQNIYPSLFDLPGEGGLH